MAKFPMLKELTIRGSIPLSSSGVELPNLYALRLETDSAAIPNSLLAHTNLPTIKQLYLPGDCVRPSNSGVNFLPIIEQAVNVQTVTITRSLKESLKRAVCERTIKPEVTAIHPPRYYDYLDVKSDEFDGLFD